MINKYNILNEAKYFSSNRLRNYLTFLPNNGPIYYISTDVNTIEL